MDLLKQRIREEGKVLPGNIIKVDGFLNHRVDPTLMRRIAETVRERFDLSELSMVLTAEASGIPLATICADTFGVPVVFAKKSKSDNIEGGLYTCDIFSYTYKKKVTLLVAKDWIRSGDKVLVVDDFLANGEALRGLCQIVHDAGAELLGVGVAIEKGFQHGGDRIREAGLNLQSLVIIDKADEDGFVFRES